MIKVKNIYIKQVGVVILFGLIFLIFSAQKKDKLLEQKEKALKEIELTNRLLVEVKKNKEYSLENLSLIENKIKNRNLIISNINNEISKIQRDIVENKEVLKSLENDLNKTKDEYAKLIYLAYKYKGNYENIMYLLAAENLDEAYKRFKYIKQYTDYRKKQVRLINALNIVIERKINGLESDKVRKLSLLTERISEIKKLNEEKSSKNSIINELRKKEKELNEDLKRKKAVAREIEKEIENLIREESKKGNLYSRLTPREKLISDDFEKNKGNLPWPTLYGVVTSQYGEHFHPVIKGVKVRNNGIDITTVKNAEVRCVFNGVVSKILSIKGANFTVIIKHGNFFTVYHNLATVDVKQGENVYTKQKIGNVFSEIEKSDANLHFEIWKELEKQDPELWLSR